MSKLLLLTGLFWTVFGADSSPKNASQAAYYLADNFAGTSFFDNFQFNTYDDPTHGEYDKSFAWVLCALLSPLIALRQAM